MNKLVKTKYDFWGNKEEWVFFVIDVDTYSVVYEPVADAAIVQFPVTINRKDFKEIFIDVEFKDVSINLVLPIREAKILESEHVKKIAVSAPRFLAYDDAACFEVYSGIAIDRRQFAAIETAAGKVLIRGDKEKLIPVDGTFDDFLKSQKEAGVLKLIGLVEA